MSPACIWGVLLAPNTGVPLEFDRDSVWTNAILCTHCGNFNRLGVFKSTRFQFT